MILNPKHSTVFYGWWVVGACGLLSLYAGGVVFFGFTAVFEPIANEFGWSYAHISLAASVRGLEAGLLAPLLGLVVDRWGPRKITFGGAIILGFGLVFLSRINSIGMFYMAFILIALGTSALSGTVLLTAVANWFRRKMSMAIGVVASGFALGGLLIPLVTVLTDIFEWRMAMVILGLGTWVIVLPLSLLIRHKPEQYGYLPDGEVSSPTTIDNELIPTQSTSGGVPVEGTAPRSVFWRIALSSMFHMMMISSMITHVMPYLNSVGITRSVSSFMASAIPVSSVGGRLSFGWLGDKIDKRHLAATSFALMALGLLLFDHISSGWMWMLVPVSLTFGTGWGGSVVMRASLLREHCSRSKFGSTYGFAIGIAMLGQIAGAPIAGWAFDKWGTYHGVWSVFAGLSVAALFAVLTIPPLKGKD